MTTFQQLQAARNARKALAIASSDVKNTALRFMADALVAATADILAANESDLSAAKGTISDVMLDRLALSESRIAGMAQGIREVADLPDPCGIILSTVVRPNGLRIEKTSVPMGVIAIIFESRPNVTSDAAALAIKAGSACVLRAGKEAHRSATAITAAMKQGLSAAGLPEAALQLIEDTSRASAQELMTARGYIDLLIPRGGKGLIRACVDQATVPVLETGTGICHIYVDESADQEMALDILENAKCSRPSVCNAAEQLLVHASVAAEFLPKVIDRLVVQRKASGKPPVAFRLDPTALQMLANVPNAGTAAAPEDFDTEFLDYIMAVSVVPDVSAAIDHISAHSTGHSEAIITRDETAAARFTREIDSAAVYVNASTRFTDGGEFGLGCEMGISTQKLHARGPLGLEELCTFKYIIRGNGQIR